MQNKLTSADPLRYASAEVLIFASDSRRGPDVEVFTGSFTVPFTAAADFFTCPTDNTAKAS